MITIDKPGRPKEELLNSLGKLKSDFNELIKKYDLQITQITDGYKLTGSKKIIFVNISVEMEITAEDGRYQINYKTTNIPQGQIDEAIVKVKEILAKY